jgi:hypothetical protein
MGVISDGNSYGIPDDLLYSFPVIIKVRFLGLFPFCGKVVIYFSQKWYNLA